jgi:hypothetical protein
MDQPSFNRELNQPAFPLRKPETQDKKSRNVWFPNNEQDSSLIINLHKHQKIISCSENARILLAFNNGDLCGRPLRTIQGPRTESKKLSALIDSIRSPASSRVERLVLYRYDKQEVECMVRASATSFQGLPACILHLLPCPTSTDESPFPSPSEPHHCKPESDWDQASPLPHSLGGRQLDAIQELDPEVTHPTYPTPHFAAPK